MRPALFTFGPGLPVLIAMVITLLGSIGVGLVWGWLLAGVADTARKSSGNVLSVTVATSFLLLEVYWLASWRGIGVSLGALVLALLLHLGWRRSLRQRFAPSAQVSAH